VHEELLVDVAGAIVLKAALRNLGKVSGLRDDQRATEKTDKTRQEKTRSSGENQDLSHDKQQVVLILPTAVLPRE
jgi:hypothetical protein